MLINKFKLLKFKNEEYDSHSEWADACLRPEVLLKERENIFGACKEIIQVMNDHAA